MIKFVVDPRVAERLSQLGFVADRDFVVSYPLRAAGWQNLPRLSLTEPGLNRGGST